VNTVCKLYCNSFVSACMIFSAYDEIDDAADLRLLMFLCSTTKYVLSLLIFGLGDTSCCRMKVAYCLIVTT